MKLADLFVEFSLKGLDVVQKGIAQIQTSLEGLKSGMESVAKSTTAAFALVTGTIGGFVAKGLAASAMGQTLAAQMNLLSRSVAGLFAPELQKLVELLGRLNAWFASLSDSQRASIARWVEIAAASLAVAVILPKVVAGIQSIVAVSKTLTLVGGPLLPLVGALASVFLAMGVAGETSANGFQPLITTVGDLAKSLAGLFARLGEALAPVAQMIGNLLIPLIQTLTDWLNSLSLSTLQAVTKWTAAIVTFGLVISIIPRVVSAIMAVVNVVRSLNVALAIKNALSGPQGWAQLAAGAAAAAAAIGVFYGIESAAEKANSAMGKAKGKAGGGRGALAPPIGGPTSLEEQFNRFNLAAIQATAGGKSPAEKLNDQMDELNDTSRGIKNGIDNWKPVVR